MDFTFTNDQTLFGDTVRKFLLVQLAPEGLRALVDGDRKATAKLHDDFVKIGLTALSASQDDDGLGCNELDWALIAQELGYHAAPDALLSTACQGVGFLNDLGAGHPLKQQRLPKVTAGEAHLAFAHPDQALVANASVADLFIVPHDGALHAVPKAAVQLTPMPSIAPMRDLARVQWTPSGKTLVADAKEARALWSGIFERGALMAAAQSLGLASRILDIAVDYSAQRKQFGKPIGSFQAVKHLMANVAVAIEFARPVLYRAAYALAHRQTDLATHVSHARIAATEAAWLAARNGMQVHGAMGYTMELDLQIFMKRAWALDAQWGDRGFHKSRIADFVLSDDAPLGAGNTFISSNSQG